MNSDFRQRRLFLIAVSVIGVLILDRFVLTPAIDYWQQSNMEIATLRQDLVAGSGTLALNGDFIFDLAGAGNTVGDSWSIVNVSTLNETFGGTFTVQGFSESAGIWSNEVYEFDESIGTLTVIPEPSSLVLVGLFAGLFVVSLKRTKR